MTESAGADFAAAWDFAMRRGDFEAAWRQTDRIELPRRAAQEQPHFVRRQDHLRWNGASFDGRRVVVRCDHGLGDTLQFVRYVPLVRRVAKRVSVLVQPPLVPLLQHSTEFGDVRDGWSGDVPSGDLEIEVMELPYVFRTTVETVPRRAPYLAVERLRPLMRDLPPLSADAQLRVGLAWSASDWDDARSVALDALAPLAEVPGVRLFSLQQGPQHDAPARVPFAVEAYSKHTQAVELAAAAMLALDLVITVDSMVAHLAGALGRPVWVMLKARADWRWMEGRDDSPWYPTMRLFRQTRAGDWGDVVARVAAALRETATR